MGSKYIKIGPTAENVPFDNTGVEDCFPTAETVDEALKELCDVIDKSASPGFTWGNSGNVVNAYLLNDTVPSNKSGRLSSVTGDIVKVFVALELATTVSVEIRRKVGVVYTTIVTANMVASRKNTFTVSVPVSVDDELSCYINGSCKSPVVGIVIKGIL